MQKMKHLLGSRSAVSMMPPPGGAPESHPVFHPGNQCDLDLSCLSQEMKDCYQGIEEFRSAMKNLDGAGTHLTESLAQVLHGTGYQQVGEQLVGGFREVYSSQCSQHFMEQLRDMETMLFTQQGPSEAAQQQDLKVMWAQTSCHMLLLFLKLQKQYFAMCHQKLATVIHHLLAARDPQLSGEVTKAILKLGLAEELCPEKTIVSLPNSPRSSPKLRKAAQHGSPKSQQRGFKWFNLFERKSSPEEGRSAFYISMPEGEGQDAGAQQQQELLVDPFSSSAPPHPSPHRAMTAGSQGLECGAVSNLPCPLPPSLPDRSPLVNMASPSPTPLEALVVTNLGSDPSLLRIQASPSPVQGQGPAKSSHAEGSLLCSVPLVTRTDEMNNECSPDFTLELSAAGHLASEEDLDSVINLLSGVHCTSPVPPLSPTANSFLSGFNGCSPVPPPSPTANSMMSIPEDPLREPSPSTPNSLHSGPELQPSRSPMQLAVPGMYRMRSPASDSQVDELQIPKLQAGVHRRSEGCLDLSGMGRSASWTHQQLQNHRASLPAVQLHAPYRHPAFDPLHDPYTSQEFMPMTSHPPPGYQSSGMVTSSSGLQWSTYSSGLCGSEMRGSGTWPLYHNHNNAPIPMGDSLNSSWSGVHEGSDGSDDSSNGDHFFAVGKDLASAIDSRHDSSDDEGNGGKNKLHPDFFDYEGQPGCTNTWPMMQHFPPSSLHVPPISDYQDNHPPPHQHRPVQMQWSDPLSTRNVWSAASPGVMAGQGLPAANSNPRSLHRFGALN